MQKYPVMQSGFVSFTDEELLIPVKYNDLVISNVLSKDYRSPSNRYFYSPVISEMYNLWCSNPQSLNDLDFREKLLHNAKKLFNSISFFKWVDLQEKYGFLGDLHQAFLIETCEYLLTGERRVHVTQWISLIEKAIKSSSTHIDLNHFFNKNAIGKTVDYDKILPSKLTDILILWSQRPRGYEDLLITLYVIFGNRPYITDVSENPRS